MTNTGRKKRRKNAVVTMAFRLFFVLLLLSMLAAYISNQVTISSKRAELETLNEQVAQQQTENQELQWFIGVVDWRWNRLDDRVKQWLHRVFLR